MSEREYAGRKKVMTEIKTDFTEGWFPMTYPGDKD